MTTATTSPRLITADEFLYMEPPPGKRYELIRGVVTGEYGGIVRRCGDVVARCGGMLFQYTEPDRPWHSAMGDPGYILERNPDTVRSLDIALTAEGRIPPGTKGFPELAPDLCVEAAYTNDALAKSLLSDKAQMWLSFGAREVWVLSPEDTTLTRYRPGMPPAILHADDVLDGGDLLPGFTVAVWRLFRRQRQP